MSESSVEEITYENFSSICRCCIINKGHMDVFETHIGDSALSTIIFTCTSETISTTEGLPRKICNACVQLLMNFHLFIKAFKEAQENIRHMYQVFRNESNADVEKNSQVENKIVQKTNGFSKEQGKLEKVTSEVNREVVDAENTSKEVTNESYSPQVSEEIDNTECPQNVGIVNFSPVHNPTEEEPKSSKTKKIQNLKKIKLDPLLRSGLDLQCFQCLLVFSSKTEMTKHHKATGHTMAPNYKCAICSKAISRRKAYWDHMAMHRHLKKKAVCEVCGAVVVSIHLKRHMLIHQEKSHFCQYCGKGYVQKSTLTDHVKRKHEGETKDMNTLCFICGKLCSDLKSLTSHLNTHSEDTKKLSHHCEECGKHFLNIHSLNTHIYMAHKVAARIPKQREKSQKRNLMLDRKKLLVTKKASGKKIAVKREPRECPICHKIICYLGYSRHLTTHTGVKPHQCKHCSKSFRLFSSLKSHMYVHLNVKPFNCDVCNQQFRHYTTLKVHKRVHTGEKPYVCFTCTRGFRSASGLKRHQKQRQHPSNFEE